MMKLYEVYLSYHYNFERIFKFLVVAEDIEQAEIIATTTFNSYKYGNCQLSSIKLLASEGQYSKPDILIIGKEPS